ncbi:MAG: aldo/keto reductase family protein, partial [Dehalococcoidia bacterium]|nr:aldo/keto reductase family protein [Dehalococcoidia bacterium]
MLQRELGDTGVMLPEIGAGTWQYRGGSPPLRRAIELGAFLIDTAENYGTEGQVGEAIKGLRDKVFVATKVSADHLHRKDVIKAAESSLKRLGIDHIDLYQ